MRSALLVLLVACGAADTTPRSAAEAVLLLEVGIGEARPEVVRPLLGASYRQHNPRVADGPEGLLDFVTALSRLPPERRVSVRVLRSFEDGELVFTHSEYRRRGPRISGFDVFRRRDGRFVEHWDVGMPERGTNPSGRGLLDGTVPDRRSRAGDTEATRSRASDFVHGLIGEDPAAFDVVAEDCVQHDPRVGDGRRAWRDSLGGALRHTELVRTMAEGEWALTQSRGRYEERPVVIDDMFRVVEGSVREHWVVWERIPDRMAHSNGML